MVLVDVEIVCEMVDDEAERLYVEIWKYLER